MASFVDSSGRDAVTRWVALSSLLVTATVLAAPAGPDVTRWASEAGSFLAAGVFLVALWAAARRSSGLDALGWWVMLASTAILIVLYLVDPIRPGSGTMVFSAAFFAGPIVTLAQIVAVGLLARRLVLSLPVFRLGLDSIWLGSAALLLTWGVVGGPVVGRSDLGNLASISLVSQVAAGALLLGFLAGIAMVSDRAGRWALAVAATPALAVATLQTVYGRAYIDGRLGFGTVQDFALPALFTVAAVIVVTGNSASIRPRVLCPGHGQMAVTLAPLMAGAVMVALSAASITPDVRLLGVVVGSVAVVRLFVLVAENGKLARILHDGTTHDPLTGLPNRLALEEMLRAVGDGPAGLLLIDLDRFKAVNDALGHAAGDELLVLVAKRLELAAGPGWTVSRLVGDEFVALTTAHPDSETMIEVGNRIIERLSLPFHLSGTEAWVSASIGASSTEDDLHPNELLDVADLARRATTVRSTGRVMTADAELRRRARDRGSMEIGIRHAVDRDELFCMFQPKVDMTNGAMVGVEALVRWRRPGVGVVPPDEFIPIAEASGLIARVDSWVLSNALGNLRRWNTLRSGGPRLQLSTNMSAWQMARIDVDVEVSRAIAWKAGIDPSQLTIELTETVLIEDPVVLAGRLRKLRDIGVGLSVDDFGSGFTSIAYLRRFPITEVKIDRDLVWEMAGDDTDEKSVAAAVIALGRSMDLDVVAEGVETKDQADSLVRLGARIAQGYFYAAPLMEEEIDELVGVPYPFAHLVGTEPSAQEFTLPVIGSSAKQRQD